MSEILFVYNQTLSQCESPATGSRRRVLYNSTEAASAMETANRPTEMPFTAPAPDTGICPPPVAFGVTPPVPIGIPVVVRVSLAVTGLDVDGSVGVEVTQLLTAAVVYEPDMPVEEPTDCEMEVISLMGETVLDMLKACGMFSMPDVCATAQLANIKIAKLLVAMFLNPVKYFKGEREKGVMKQATSWEDITGAKTRGQVEEPTRGTHKGLRSPLRR
ncbi:hypothetical protein F5Y00DRAFT_229592 [Daldinia vernicosa]|uniref:uncharacterized protein n=1 Tax=Daldinia vernicosa TaxID=114800 RepID=UPI002007F1E2|nr:uncharacterized protein F5Y00DRAFT_229592 [Daldinia vernicosa]KAI0851384.1 hypothetical protein F5Y00DRAFT_229592 [Daldinia vernicosa]